MRSIKLFLLFLCFTSLPALPVSAQKIPASFAISSIVGDTVSVVSQQKQTGRLVDSNRKQSVELPEQGLDGEIMLLTQQLVNAQCQNCQASLLRIKPVVTPEEGEKLLPGLLGAAKNAKADRLIVLIKHRADARIPFDDGQSRGQGKLVGLGFYTDSTTEVKNSTTLAITTGYLAPFAFYQLLVVDVASGDVIFSKNSMLATPYFVNERETFGIWNAISDDKKVPTLLNMIKEDLAKSLTFKNLGLSK
jgi:hypothetical protein